MKYMVHGDENVNSLITQYNVYQSTILIKKAELIIKAIKPACRVLMEPISHSCKVEFESTFNYTKNILFDNDHHGDVRLHFQQSFCCALSHYNDCVMKSIERINTYSLDFCDEIDVLSVESILIGLDKQYETQNSSDMIIRCPKNIWSQIKCNNFYFDRNFYILFITTLGMATVLVALSLSSYTFYLTLKKRITFKSETSENEGLMNIFTK